MKLQDIIKIADSVYPDGLVKQYFDTPSGNHGDSLAKFIAIELKETYDPKASKYEQLSRAFRVMYNAANEIRAVADAFENEAADAQ